jgi:hypothetical protein
MLRTISLTALSVTCNLFASYAQPSGKESEIRKIIRLAISDVKLNYLLDSTHLVYVYYLTFSINPETNRPIIQNTCDYPQGSFDITAKKLEKFEAVDVNWNILIPGFSRQDIIFLPIVVSRDTDKQMKKPCFTMEQHMEIAGNCLANSRWANNLKIMEPLYYYEQGSLH